MAGTLHTDQYRTVIRALVSARNKRGFSQGALALLIGRPPSFVAKVELCERRLDIIEFCVWVTALAEDPSEFMQVHLSSLPSKIPR